VRRTGHMIITGQWPRKRHSGRMDEGPVTAVTAVTAEMGRKTAPSVAGAGREWKTVTLSHSPVDAHSAH